MPKPFHAALPNVNTFRGDEVLNTPETRPVVLAERIVRVSAGGERVMLAGPPGSRKTWVALAVLLEAILHGHNALLFLGEGSIWALAERLVLLAAWLDLDLAKVMERLLVVSGPFLLTHPATSEAVAAVVEAHGPAIVHLDPLVHYLDGDENSSTDMIANMLCIQTMLAGKGITTVLAHHTRKPRDGVPVSPRGSGAFEGFLDVLYTITPAGRHCSRIHNAKRRDADLDADRRVTLEVSDNRLSIELSAESEGSPESGEGRPTRKRASTVQTRVLEMLPPNGSTKSEIRASLKCSGVALNTALDDLIENGVLVLDGDGRAACYRRA